MRSTILQSRIAWARNSIAKVSLNLMNDLHLLIDISGRPQIVSKGFLAVCVDTPGTVPI